MLLNPRVQVKAVERDSVTPNRNGRQARAYLSFKDGTPHAAIGGRVTCADQSGRDHR